MSNDELNTLIILHGFFQLETIFSLEDKKEKIVVLESRPRLESAQHTIDELTRVNMMPTLIADNMAGFLFFRNLVKEVHLTYQDQNSDGVLTLIGGLILAVMASKHKVPIYAYPAERTVNLMDDEKSILSFNNESVGYQGVQGYVPLVEWVPHKYITKVHS